MTASRSLLSWLALSVAVNLGAALYWFQIRSTDTAVAHAQPRPLTLSSPQESDRSPSEGAQGWSEPVGEDYDQLLANLKQAGMPPAEIAAVFHILIVTRWEQSGYEWMAATPYWKTSNDSNPDEAEKKRLARYAVFLRADTKYLLSPDLVAANELGKTRARLFFGDISDEKIRQIALASAAQTLALLDEKAQGTLSPDNEKTRWQRLDEENEATLKSILTPQEFAEHQLRSSELAMEQRNRLGPFQPSEEEYKIVMAEEAALREARKNPALTDAERAALRPATDAAVAAKLGPERGADYLALRKYNGQPVAHLMARLNLPLATLTAIDAVQANAQSQAKTIRADSTLSAEQRAAQLQSLTANTRQQLSHTLGDEGLAAYRSISSDWLGQLEQPEPGKP